MNCLLCPDIIIFTLPGTAVRNLGFAAFKKKTDGLKSPTITSKLLLVVENSNIDDLYFEIKSDFILAI